MSERELIEQFIARLTTVRDGWQHKSKWNNEMGSTFLETYIKDYKDRLDLLLDDEDRNR